MMGEVPKAISESILEIGGIKMRAYVLEDGRRIINSEDLVKFFDRLSDGLDMDTIEQREVDELARFLRAPLPGPP